MFGISNTLWKATVRIASSDAPVSSWFFKNISNKNNKKIIKFWKHFLEMSIFFFLFTFWYCVCQSYFHVKRVVGSILLWFLVLWSSDLLADLLWQSKFRFWNICLKVLSSIYVYMYAYVVIYVFVCIYGIFKEKLNSLL